jgi:cell wall-associated NlpC family hydrolase
MIVRVLALVVALPAVAAVSTGCASARTTVATPSPFPGAPVIAGPAPAPAVPGASAVRADAIVDTALALEGTPYQFGGSTPATGFDCSGLVQYVFSQEQVALPRTVAEQYRVGHRVDRDEVEAGDLVFFSTTGPGATHVGIAIDHARFIHAPDTGAVVRVERLDTPYWHERMTGAKRIP